MVTGVRLALRRTPVAAAYPYDFALQIRKRGRAERLSTLGWCREDRDGLHCSVECDGGGVEVATAAGEATMRLDRIRMTVCGQDRNDAMAAEDVAGGLDDRTFRLTRIDPASDPACVVDPAADGRAADMAPPPQR